MENHKKYDVIALGELLIDFTPAGTSAQGNPVLEQNPGGAPCNVLAMLAGYGRSTGQGRCEGYADNGFSRRVHCYHQERGA